MLSRFQVDSVYREFKGFKGTFLETLIPTKADWKVRLLLNGEEMKEGFSVYPEKGFLFVVFDEIVSGDIEVYKLPEVRPNNVGKVLSYGNVEYYLDWISEFLQSVAIPRYLEERNGYIFNEGVKAPSFLARLYGLIRNNTFISYTLGWLFGAKTLGSVSNNVQRSTMSNVDAGEATSADISLSYSVSYQVPVGEVTADKNIQKSTGLAYYYGEQAMPINTLIKSVYLENNKLRVKIIRGVYDNLRRGVYITPTTGDFRVYLHGQIYEMEASLLENYVVSLRTASVYTGTSLMTSKQDIAISNNGVFLPLVFRKITQEFPNITSAGNTEAGTSSTLNGWLA